LHVFSKSVLFTLRDLEISLPHKIIASYMKKTLQPAVLLWLLFSLICGILVSKAAFTADMSAFLPRHPSERQQLLIDQISEGAASRSLIVGIEGAPAPVLAKLSTAIGQELRGLPAFKSVSNGQREANQKDQELLFNNRYLISPTMNASRMSVEGLRAAVEENLAEVSSSAGLFSKSLLGKDPTGESLEILKRVIPTDQPSLTEGVWMNTKSTKALLLLQTHAQGSDLDAQESAHHAVSRSFEVAKSKIGTASTAATLKYSGPGVFAVNSRDTIKSEAAYLSAVGTLMVLGLLWVVYRSLTTLLLGMIPVVTGAIAGITAVSLGFSSVHGMTIGFGITLIGEAVDYAIYLFVQYMPASKSNGNEIAQDTPTFSASFWPTIRLGVLTSIVGFSTMLFSGFTGLAQLGLFSIVGIVVAAITTRYVLPVLLPSDFQVRQPKQLGSALVKVVDKLKRLKISILLVTAFAVVFLVSRVDTLWSMELGGLSPVAETAQKLDADLRAELGAPDAGMLIVLKAPSSELVLQLSEKVSAQLEPLVKAGVLGGFQSPSNYLPSQQIQLNRKTSIPEDAELRRRMALALQGLPLSTDKLDDFFVDIAAAKIAQPLKRADLENTSLSLGVDSLMMQDTKSSQGWTALVVLQPPVKNGSQQNLDARTINDALSSFIEKTASNSQPSVFLIELKTEATNLYKAYLSEAVQLTIAGFLAILALLFVTLRSGVRVFRVFAPLLVSVVWVAAALVLFKGSLNLLHLVGLLLVIAVGSNYALFFDQRSNTQINAPLSGQSTENEHSLLSSLFFANLTTVLGFGILSFSSVPVMNSLGMTVSSGAFLALALSASFATTHQQQRKAMPR
jgi:predicted exporter